MAATDILRSVFNWQIGSIASSVSPEKIALQMMIEAAKYVVEVNRKLDIINENVNILIRRPYETGLLHLEDASKEDRTMQEVLASIDKAKDNFFEAYSCETDSGRKALIASKIGRCYAFINKRNDTIEWFEKAYNFAEDAESDYKKEYDKFFSNKSEIIEKLEKHYEFMRLLPGILLRLGSKLNVRYPDAMNTQLLLTDDSDYDKYQMGQDMIDTMGKPL